MNYTNDSILENLISVKLEMEEHLGRVRLKNQKPEQIIDDVCKEFGVPPKMLLSKSRTDWVVEVRRCLVWVMRSCGVSYPQMSVALDMNHATLIYHFREFPKAFFKMSDINQESLIKIVKKYGGENNYQDKALQHNGNC